MDFNYLYYSRLGRNELRILLTLFFYNYLFSSLTNP
jgi:hypothetical protein